MATTTKVLYRGAPGSAPAVVYTTPAATTTVVTSIVVGNPTASATTFTLSLNSVALASSVSLAANSFTVIDLKQVLAATQTITASASASVTFHISGVEIA